MGDREDLERRIERYLANGERSAAVAAAIRGYGDEILGFLVNRLGDRSAGREVFSTFCDDLLKGIGTFRGESSFRTWAFQIARNAAARHLSRGDGDKVRRLRTSEVSRLRDPAWSDTSPRPAREATPAWLRTTLKTRFAEIRRRLSPEDLQLLELRIADGLSWTEIAERLARKQKGATDEAARRRLEADLRQRFHRLKEKLRRLAREEGLL